MMRIFISLFTLFVLVSCHNTKETKRELNYKLHTFYYNWYGNPEMDGEFRHWAHDVLPHWSDTSWNNLPRFKGGGDIGANFYPSLGCYSSRDTSTIRQHMEMIAQEGIGVISLSWWGVNSFEDESVNDILNAAEKQNIKVNFHLEPIPNRNAQKTLDMIKYLIDTYGDHTAFHKENGKPLFYIYDSYLTPSNEWASFLHSDSSNSIRGSKYDAIMIGLLLNESDTTSISKTCFDGFYTYFASDGFTYGSTAKNWKQIAQWSKRNNKIFIPCVGPGYSDTRIRPWNAQNFKSREEGKYYDIMFKSAINNSPNFIGITSFNEWHEGTQIEPSAAKTIGDYSYEDFSPQSEKYYLERTRFWSEQFK